MTNGGAVTLDTVMIKVESDAGKANSNISNLANTLRDLKSATAGGFNNIKKLGTALQGLRDGSKGLGTTVANLQKLDSVTSTLTKLSNIKAPSGLRQTIKRLNELSETSKTLYTTAYRLSSIDKIVQPLQALTTINTPTGLTAIVKNLKGLDELGSVDNIVSEMSKIPQIVQPLSQLSTIMDPRGFKKAVDNLGKLPEVISKFDTTTLENVKRVSEELAQSLAPLAEKMQQISEGYSAFSKIQNTFGKSASTTTKYAKQQKSIITSLGSAASKAVKGVYTLSKNIMSAFGKKAVSSMKHFHSQFKQIFLSLLGTRTLFTLIRKGASEYMNFDQTLQKFATNVWRAFGAQLAPAIEYAMKLFKEFVRVVYSVIYAITGIDLIAKANAKAMEGWSKSAKDTLGNLQKFDDLNVVEFPKGDEDKELIEMDKIDLSPIQKVIDWVRKLKEEIQEALSTGEWYNVGKVFAEGISEGIEYLNKNIHVVRNTLFGIAKNLGDLLNGVIENTNWEAIGEFITNALILIPDVITEFLKTIHWDEIGKGINKFFKGFEPATIIHSISEMFRAALIGFGDMLAELDWSIIGPKISDAIATFFKDIGAIIDAVPWSEIGKAVREAIENIKWGEVWKAVVDGFKEAIKGINEFVSALTGIDTSTLEAIEIVIAGIGAAFITFDIIKKFQTLFSILGNIAKIFKAGSLLSAVGLFAGIAAAVAGLVLAIQGLIEFIKDPSWQAFWDILAGIALVVAGIALAMGGWVVAIVAAVVSLVGMIASYLAEHWAEVTEWWNGVVTSVKGWFANMGAAISEWWNGLLTGIATFFSNIGKAISDWWAGVQSWWAGVKQWWGQKFNDFAKWVDEKLVQPVLSFIESLKAGIAEKMNMVGQTFNNVKNWIKEKINDIKEAIKPVAEWIYNKLIKPVQDKFNDMKNKFGSIWTEIKTKWNSFWEDGLWVGCKKIINKMLDGAEKFVNGIVSGINGLSSGIRKVGNKIFDIIGVDIKFDPISKVSIPKLATGTNEIPNEGLYHLHPGEAVVPKKYNPALGNGGSEEMNAKLDTLIDIMNNMNFTNIVNVGNKKLYEGQQAFNKTQQNKYGTINLY